MVVETLDLRNTAVATQVLGVQRAAYQVEADLIASTEIPPLHESLPQLTASPLLWRGIRVGEVVIAAIAFTQAGCDVDIDRLVVSPGFMRQGYGSALLKSLDDTATVTVSTGTKNAPAREFYLRHGFELVGQSEPVPGLSVTNFVRSPR